MSANNISLLFSFNFLVWMNVHVLVIQYPSVNFLFPLAVIILLRYQSLITVL